MMRDEAGDWLADTFLVAAVPTEQQEVCKR